jgi:hypothetical protein
MDKRLRDAQSLLGIGLACVGYALYFAYDYWYTKRRLAELEQARLILESDSESAQAHRTRLLAEEGVPNAE